MRARSLRLGNALSEPRIAHAAAAVSFTEGDGGGRAEKSLMWTEAGGDMTAHDLPEEPPAKHGQNGRLGGAAARLRGLFR